MPRKPSDQPDAPTMSEDDATAELARLGQALQSAAGDREKQQAAIKDVERLLTSLSSKDFPALADNPVVVAFLDRLAQQRAADSDDPPGTIYNRGTIAVHSKPWTFNDLKSPPEDWRRGQPLPRGHVEWVWDYVPRETRLVVWNGLPVQFFAEVPWSGPKVFADEMESARQRARVAHEHASYMFRSGGIPSDPGVINEATRRVRAQSTNGGVGTGFRAGAGIGPAFFAGQEGDDAPDGDGDATEGEAA